MKIYFEENYLLSELTDSSIQIDYLDLFRKIENEYNKEMYIIKTLAIYVANSDRQSAINLVYKNKFVVNKFVFFWFLCEYFYYKGLINLSDTKFFNNFVIADKFAIVSILLLLKKILQNGDIAK